MRRPFTVMTAIALFAQLSVASTASDILSLTGNARTKLAWVRFPWCDTSYNPIQAYASDAALENSGPHTQLMIFDTDLNGYRFLDSALGAHQLPRFTRKDGNFVIWTDGVNHVAWIRDFAGTAPKRQLINGGDFFVVAGQYNPATGQEFIYVLSASGSILYRVPLKTDYTVDMTQKFAVYSGGQQVNECISVSADGKYIGEEIPWPNCAILNVATGAQLARRADGAFGCEPNMAADTSYRFFHLRDDHKVIRMWDGGLSTNNWDVIVNGMPGNNAGLDCSMPRWSNNVRFFTNGYPLVNGQFIQQYASPIFSMSAAAIKAADPCNAGAFCFGKFSQDFTTVEKYVLVSDGDVRHREVCGDAWVAGSSDNTPPSAPANLHGTALSESKISLTWNAAVDAESGIMEYDVYRGSARIATVNTAAFTDSLLSELTSYTYQVSAVNGAGIEGPKCAAVTVTSLADAHAAAIAGVYALDAPTQVTVVFSEPVEKASAENIANYATTPGITVTAAVLGADSMSVVLTVSSMTSGTQYTLTVNNVRDRAKTPNAIAANSQKTFTYFLCGDTFDAGAINTAVWTTALKGSGGSVAQQGGTLQIKPATSGQGSSAIWPDQNNFGGIYRSDITGDFDVWVKAVDPGKSQWSQQGILVANNVATTSLGGFCAVSLNYQFDVGYVFYADLAAPLGQIDQQYRTASITPVFPSWLRLARKGNQFTAYYSIVGPYQWLQIGAAATISSATVSSRICLFGTSSQSANQATLLFDAFGCTQAVGGGGTAAVPGDASRHLNCQGAWIELRGRVLKIAATSPGIRLVEIVSPLGRRIARKQAVGPAAVCWDLGREPAGVYLVKITAGDAEIAGRIVVSH